MATPPLRQKKQVTVTLTFTVEIDENNIPTEGVNARPGGTERAGDDGWWREYDARQRRLLSAVVSHPELCAAYVRYKIAGFLEDLSSAEWEELLDVQDILEQAIALLPEEDQQFFAGANEAGVLFEATEIFYDCWEPSLAAVTLTEYGEVTP